MIYCAQPLPQLIFHASGRVVFLEPSMNLLALVIGGFEVKCSLPRGARQARRYFGITIPTLKLPFGSIYRIVVSNFTLQHVLKVKPQLGRPAVSESAHCAVHGSFPLNSIHAVIQESLDPNSLSLSLMKIKFISKCHAVVQLTLG